MTTHADKLRTAVKELEQELRAVESLDDETRNVLEEALGEIQAALRPERPSGLEPQGLSDRLGDVARGFEGTHPTLTGILARLIDGLGQMGI